MIPWRAVGLIAVTPLLMAAVRDRELNLQVPANPSDLAPFAAPSTNSGPPVRLQPAPLPNRDVELTPPRSDNSPSLAPTLFTRPDQYRGDGFSKGSTAQSEQEKRVKPGAGFSLHLPLSPN